MSDFFRIIRGLEIDESVRVLQGAGAPGTTADTNAAQVGSLYLDNTAGNSWTKLFPGSGSDKWSSVSTTLFTERPVSPTLPSAGGDNSVAIGPGAQTDTLATNSIALGSQSLARHTGALVFANGRFGSTGDVQAGKYLLRTHTVNASVTEAFLDGTGGTRRLIVPDDATWTFTVTVTAHRTDASDGHAGYKVEGIVYRGAGPGTIAFQGNPVKTVLGESNAAWDINITTDPTNGSLRIQVQGQTGKTIRWAALVETLEVTN